jgi:hypothetical protein
MFNVVPNIKEERISIKIRDVNNNGEVFFRIKNGTLMGKVMSSFCERQGRQSGTVRFLFEGRRINPDDTPLSIDLQNADVIEAHTEQLGGAW